MPRTNRPSGANLKLAETYTHYDTEAVARPEVGVQAQFRKKLPPKKYRYDPTLDPELAWNEAPVDDEVVRLWDQAVNARTLEEAQAALRQLNQIAAPSLRWAGKAERSEFSVPTLPLFVHERLSTKGILETLQGHKRDKQMAFDMFGDAQLPITDRVLKAYEHKDRWVNRMILGDSLQVMNSLLEYESMGGQAQMIYMDPPYGVKFGSNFQPFVRSREVTHNRDEDLSREPETVQAYRDTWELGLHSYLSYLRDRLRVARELLADSGSVFMQIGDENLHLVRDVMDDVFGPGNFCGLIAFRTTGGQSSSLLSSSTDFLLWYAKSKELAKARFSNPTVAKAGGSEASGQYTLVEPTDGSEEPREMTPEERSGAVPVPAGWRILAHDTLYSQGAPGDASDRLFEWRGRRFTCPPNSHWKPGVLSGGMQRLADANRLMLVGNTLRYKRYVDDFPVYLLDNVWNDTGTSGFSRKKQYVVETNPKVVERCILMTTQPGDLVLDPTCGSGTTAAVAERWGRRWITVDTSRVPLALARQRLLTATYPYFKLNQPSTGLSGGFEYRPKESSGNRKSDGPGIIPHVTLGSIANDEPPATEVLVDRPERDYSVTRVSGPFVVEATIPTPVDLDGDGVDDAPPEPNSDVALETADYFSRMFETLRRVRRVKLPGGGEVEFGDVRQPASKLTLSAEATVEDAIVGIVFGPENGAISERLVFEAAREAYGKSLADLYVFGFAIEPNARQLIERCIDVVGIHANYVAVTPDIAMGDLLKNQRSSQVFSVAGLPDVRLLTAPEGKFRIELLGLDTFDPASMETDSMKGDEVPAWFLDTNYNAQGTFVVDQAFFPRTSAWDNLRRELRGRFEDSVWDALAGTLSEPFEAPETGSVAVKVIDDRGNELIVVKSVADAVEA